jgi:hypothetical protein
MKNDREFLEFLDKEREKLKKLQNVKSAAIKLQFLNMIACWAENENLKDYPKDSTGFWIFYDLYRNTLSQDVGVRFSLDYIIKQKKIFLPDEKAVAKKHDPLIEAIQKKLDHEVAVRAEFIFDQLHRSKSKFFNLKTKELIQKNKEKEFLELMRICVNIDNRYSHPGIIKLYNYFFDHHKILIDTPAFKIFNHLKNIGAIPTLSPQQQLRIEIRAKIKSLRNQIRRERPSLLLQLIPKDPPSVKKNIKRNFLKIVDIYLSLTLPYEKEQKISPKKTEECLNDMKAYFRKNYSKIMDGETAQLINHGKKLGVIPDVLPGWPSANFWNMPCLKNNFNTAYDYSTSESGESGASEESEESKKYEEKTSHHLPRAG